MIDSEAKKWSAFIHLGTLLGYVFPFGHILGPIIIWMIKKDSDPFIDENGKSAINFQISFTIYSIIICMIFFFAAFAFAFASSEAGIIFIPMLFLFIFVFFLIEIIFIALGASSAYNGKVYRYPLTIRFLK
jgi:uncharacterized Tic20 family protein